jgi:hypothetical protein
VTTLLSGSSSGPVTPTTIRAGTGHVEPMIAGQKAVGGRDVRHGPRHILLETRGHDDVDDSSALQTHEVVVVLGQLLVEFEARETVA